MMRADAISRPRSRAATNFREQERWKQRREEERNEATVTLSHCRTVSWICIHTRICVLAMVHIGSKLIGMVEEGIGEG